VRTLPLSPLVALVLAGCASSPKPSDGTVQPDRPEEIRITYRGAGAQGRALSARRDTDLARDTEVRAPAARVWQAVPLAYERLGITVAKSDPTLGTLNTVYTRARARIGRARISTYLDCGSGALGLPNADNYEVSFQVTTHVFPDRHQDDSSHPRTRHRQGRRGERRRGALLQHRRVGAAHRSVLERGAVGGEVAKLDWQGLRPG
jgi:hypothetical protein